MSGAGNTEHLVRDFLTALGYVDPNTGGAVTVAHRCLHYAQGPFDHYAVRLDELPIDGEWARRIAVSTKKAPADPKRHMPQVPPAEWNAAMDRADRWRLQPVLAVVRRGAGPAAATGGRRPSLIETYTMDAWKTRRGAQPLTEVVLPGAVDWRPIARPTVA